DVSQSKFGVGHIKGTIKSVYDFAQNKIQADGNGSGSMVNNRNTCLLVQNLSVCAFPVQGPHPGGVIRSSLLSQTGQMHFDERIEKFIVFSLVYGPEIHLVHYIKTMYKHSFGASEQCYSFFFVQLFK